MNFSDLNCCPFCGGDEFYTIEEFFGNTSNPRRFDAKEALPEKIFDSIANTYKVNAYCRFCRCYLGDLLKDSVGAFAASAKGRDKK